MIETQIVAAFCDELEKTAQLETLRHGFKAAKNVLLGGTKLRAAPGMLLPERQQAVSAGQRLMSSLRGGGINIHRARVKTPESIVAKGLTTTPDDLLGMQMYGRGPQDVQRAMSQLKAQGVSNLAAESKVRPGYHGVNIKGMYGETPLELQIHPSRTSTFGSLMEHSLGYKQPTEAPRATMFDKWFGRRIAPRMVSQPSWIPRSIPQLQAMGVA